MLELKEYQDFIANQCFISEENEKYNLMRAGLELAEEIHEYYFAHQPKEEFKELGDIFFWSCLIDYWLNDKDDLLDIKLDEVSGVEMEKIIAKILGGIKRYYRDNNLVKLKEVVYYNRILLNRFLYIHFEYDFYEIIEANYIKLKERLENNKIQGEGDNR